MGPDMGGADGFDPRQYWEQRLAADYTLGGVGHLGLGRAYNGWMYGVRRVVFDRILRMWAGDLEAARVLDVGSGTGFYLDRWLSAGVRELEGLDLTAHAVERLRRRHPNLTIHRADIGSESVTSDLRGDFDLISAMDVLFHIVDDDAFRRSLHNLASLLKPGGLLIFSDNFLHGPEMRRSHIVHRRLEQTRAVLAELGLEVLDRRPMFVLMTAPVDSSSWLLHGIWQLISLAARIGNGVGAVLGMLLFPLELVLVSLKSEGPTTEVMVCRKRDRTGNEP